MEKYYFSKIADEKPATLLKVTLLHGCFSRFLNCTNGTKSCKTSLRNLFTHANDSLHMSIVSAAAIIAE